MRNFKRTKLSCYVAYFTMSSVFCLPPLLFVTFRGLYGISWTALGTLVLVNFCTQLAVDLIFGALSSRISIKWAVRVMPIITSLGLLIYALMPKLFPAAAYAWLVLGTVIFSVASGLSEVLLSPIIAAIPSQNPGRDMSFLHSLYAFGVFFAVVTGTLFLKFVGDEYWSYMVLFFAALPLISAVLFMTSPFPDMQKNDGACVKARGARGRTTGIILCVLIIFLGSCAENAMSNWISGYMEAQLHIDKALGDILGVAGFAILLGLSRIAYARWGKSITKTLLVGMIGAALCYLVVGLTPFAPVAFFACTLTGVFTAMLWPGTLIMLEEKVEGAGVAAFALMAAGGDLGASVAPQLLGIIADTLGLQAGMLISSVFPILGTVFVLIAMRYFKVK